MRLIESMTVVALGLMVAICNADTIYVCWDGSGDHLTIQAGIDAAQDGDEVVVCDGTYTGTGNKNLDFGGRLITVRSANGPDNCIIDCQQDGRGFHFHSGESAASILEGFTIRGGDVGRYADGGGIVCWHSEPTITNCVVVANTALRGGGVYLQGSDAAFGNCIVMANTAELGGGVFCFACSPTFTDCTFRSNAANTSGGGMFLTHGNPAIANCIVASNGASGVCQREGGGAIFCRDANPKIVLCTIACNVSEWGGGGLLAIYYSTPALTSCRVIGNGAERGGAVCCFGAGATIADSTLAHNTAWDMGGAYWGFAGTTLIANCVLWGDCVYQGGPGPELYLSEMATVSVSYNDVQGGEGNAYVGDGCTLDWGSGNIDADPLFAHAYHGVWTEQAAYDPDAYQITFVDTSADWAGSQLIGRLLNADLNPMVIATYRIVANTQTTVTVWADETTVLNGGLWWDFAGKSYEISDHRPAAGSPCIDAADNEAVPADKLDLDEDNDTDEPIPFDLEYNPRFIDDPYTDDTGNPDPDYPDLPIVDMGAYESKVPCPGDIDADGDTDHADLGALLGAWDSQPGDPHWNPDADLDGDGHIGHGDLGILLTDWGCGT